MKIENWLGEDNQIGIDIWNKKYCYEDETFDGWLDRVFNNPDEIVTACPLCLKTFARKSPVKVQDIAEIVSKSI